MNELTSSLPNVMVEIAQAAGIEAAWALARACGGSTVYIPRRATPGHWLTELVGFEAATKICDHYRVANTGARLLIPLAKHAHQRERLVRALEAGLSATSAAAAAGMHERTAFRTRKRLQEDGVEISRPDGKQGDDRQIKLF